MLLLVLLLQLALLLALALFKRSPHFQRTLSVASFYSRFSLIPINLLDEHDEEEEEKQDVRDDEEQEVEKEKRRGRDGAWLTRASGTR